MAMNAPDGEAAAFCCMYYCAVSGNNPLSQSKVFNLGDATEHHDIRSDYAQHHDSCNAAFVVNSDSVMSSIVVRQLWDHLCAKLVSNVIYSNLLRAPFISKAIRPSQNVNRRCSIQCLQPIRLLWYIWSTNLCQLGVVRPLIHWHGVCLQQHIVP